ncbi:nucleosome assembly protein [Pelomyxa schiedti]|nr:nucleosome assembly protein [Pelomyxa schiedti]
MSSARQSAAIAGLTMAHPIDLTTDAGTLAATAAAKPGDDLPNDVRKRVHALRFLEDEHAKLMKRLTEEQDQLVLKYAGLAQPIFDARRAIVTGEKEPTEEQTVGFSEHPTAPPPAGKGIPKFWCKAILHNDVICNLTELSPHDVEALEYLQNIQTELIPKQTTLVNGKEQQMYGFTLLFTFSPNPFFSDATLTKSFFFTVNDSKSEIHHTESAPPHWKEGKILTLTTVRHRKNGRMETVTKPRKSFFDFFVPLPPLFFQLSSADMKKRSIEATVGLEFKEVLCPNALGWYLGEMVSEEPETDSDEAEGLFDDSDGEGDEDGLQNLGGEDKDEDDDEEEEREEEDDDEEDDKPLRFRGKRPRFALSAKSLKDTKAKHKPLFSTQPQAVSSTTTSSESPKAPVKTETNKEPPAPPPECKNQ